MLQWFLTLKHLVIKACVPAHHVQIFLSVALKQHSNLTRRCQAASGSNIASWLRRSTLCHEVGYSTWGEGTA